MRYLFTIIYLVFHISLDAQQPFTCRGQYYLSLTKSGSKSSGLYEVLISRDGLNVSLDTISSGLNLVLNGMGYRITDNLIYGVDPSTGALRKVGSDGIAVDLGIPLGLPIGQQYYAGDVTPDGKFLILIGLDGNPQLIRIDLEDPNFACTFIPIKTNSIGIVDVAFDPFTGILYGHDFIDERIHIIDIYSGEINRNFIKQPKVNELGAIFFDSFGNLYGYGSYGTFDQDKFVSINKVTGEISLLSQGPLSSGQDGCACPYTLQLQKIVEPEVAYPCTEVVYSFIVSNGSGTTRSNISLIDTMPVGLMAKEVIQNPFGGNVVLNGNILSLTNMVVPVGIDTVKVVVEVGRDALGLYKNQAVLSGLPIALGSFTFSDDPFTFIEKDSTELMVLPLDLSFLAESFKTCPGDSVLVDATLHGLTYLWSDGDTSAQKWLPSPSSFSLRAMSGCDEKTIDIEVSNDLLTLSILEDTILINLGDDILLKSEYSNVDDDVVFDWTTEDNPDVDCKDCQNTTVVPHFNGYYYLEMVNGDGCIVIDSVYIRVAKDRTIYSPNIISANGDNINDYFFLTGNALSAKGLYLRIYDRWGNMVFVSGKFQLNEFTDGWDGTFKGKSVVNGVYVWVAMMQYIDGFQQMLSGDVTVIR